MIFGANYLMRESMRKALCRKTSCCKSGKNAGFSLIELAIVMVIIGLLTAPMIQSYRIYIDNKHRDDTTLNMTLVSSSLTDFFLANGRYPCPSDLSIAFGNPGHGLEECTKLTTVIPAGNCQANNGLCRMTQGGVNVQIGGVPYATLKIPFSQALDGWKHLFTYSVTEPLTVTATFNPAGGAIVVNDEFGAPDPNGPYHGIIVSAGDDGAGAFNVEGARIGCVMAYAESENCDNADGTFLTALRTDVQGANYYDDMILPSTWTQSGIWDYTAGNPNDIQSQNTGNIGVGTTSPTEKLEVVGNVLASNGMYSTQFCDTAGANCMLPDVIGGAGRSCPTGQVMYGIANNNVLCKSVSVPPSTGTCGPGQFVNKIVAGVVQCATP